MEEFYISNALIACAELHEGLQNEKVPRGQRCSDAGEEVVEHSHFMLVSASLNACRTSCETNLVLRMLGMLTVEVVHRAL